ncbi:hypothetical protein CBR_g3261 [Chara braunii]|uniref:Uncharacterized protein n=1 Tax=Chara braunii TaxID=69332 RepID=A0A388KF93_CHABU|nr:hypothetical protein CBR_g3261 [Chara braunii]|eukprot:GBG68719.1 hypothetical protein CBR_g3261 [Chara braunii]
MTATATSDIPIIFPPSSFSSTPSVTRKSGRRIRFRRSSRVCLPTLIGWFLTVCLCVIAPQGSGHNNIVLRWISLGALPTSSLVLGHSGPLTFPSYGHLYAEGGEASLSVPSPLANLENGEQVRQGVGVNFGIRFSSNPLPFYKVVEILKASKANAVKIFHHSPEFLEALAGVDIDVVTGIELRYLAAFAADVEAAKAYVAASIVPFVPRVRIRSIMEHELLEHFQPPISDALLRNRFNDDRQLRFDIQRVNVSAPNVADLAVYSLLAQRVTYAGVYVDISPVPGQESTGVFIEFRAIQVATNFVHSIATFIEDLTVLPGHDREPAYRFLRDYALQVARSVARVQARGTHRFTTYEGLLRRAPEGALALLPYPMRNFLEYLVELTDVEQLPPADKDAWELHQALYSSVVLGMFTFFVEHEIHNIGEFLDIYYVITKPKPERKEGTVALYLFGRIGTNRSGLLQLIHIELLSIAQVIAADEEDLQLRLRTASAPCRTYNAAVRPDYLAREGESVVDFGRKDRPLRPPSSYPKPTALKAPRKKTVPKRWRSPSPEAQGSRVGPVEEFAQPAPVRRVDPVLERSATLIIGPRPGEDRGDPEAIRSRRLTGPASPISIAMEPGRKEQDGDWDEFHIPHPDPPSSQDRSDFATPPGYPGH